MDYKDLIQGRHEDLCFEFEDLHARQPTPAESLELYEEAKWIVDGMMEARGDWLRKQAMGE